MTQLFCSVQNNCLDVNITNLFCANTLTVIHARVVYTEFSQDSLTSGTSASEAFLYVKTNFMILFIYLTTFSVAQVKL